MVRTALLIKKYFLKNKIIISNFFHPEPRDRSTRRPRPIAQSHERLKSVQDVNYCRASERRLGFRRGGRGIFVFFLTHSFYYRRLRFLIVIRARSGRGFSSYRADSCRRITRTHKYRVTSRVRDNVTSNRLELHGGHERHLHDNRNIYSTKKRSTNAPVVVGRDQSDLHGPFRPIGLAVGGHKSGRFYARTGEPNVVEFGNVPRGKKSRIHNAYASGFNNAKAMDWKRELSFEHFSPAIRHCG